MPQVPRTVPAGRWADLWDVWDDEKDKDKPALLAVRNLPLRSIKPRNLHSGIFRGGRRPLDIYYRLRGGIDGAGMPAFDKLSEEEIWHVMDYVRDLPFEADGELSTVHDPVVVQRINP